MNTILKIDFLHHIGGGADKKTRNEHLTLQSKNKATKGKKDIELANCQEINKQFSYDKITEVYLSSQGIDRRSIIDFFESTCELALERVDQMEFFEITQKIAQCVELNNSRPYEEWQAIFEVISRYYILIIKRCKEKSKAADIIYCIDAFKQIVLKGLSMKETISTGNQLRTLNAFTDLVKGKERALTDRDQLRA